ncbi:hypothetical protein EVAR_35950_1 [Eumeta japonica]|uniref:Uncharacterized protein n=1 Tax=Eumeta variegata TaxID=151549 RepID=A0A4C1W596_EUMVA|nr:hypothetical protein EVAR_35950_1 [Eumeta japonica]
MERSHRDFLDIDDVRLSTTQIYKYNPNTTNGVAAACMLSRSTFILCNVHTLKVRGIPEQSEKRVTERRHGNSRSFAPLMTFHINNVILVDMKGPMRTCST